MWYMVCWRYGTGKTQYAVWYVGAMVQWYGVVDILSGKICLVVWHVPAYKVREGRIRRMNICNDLIY